jgi:asparagine synthase (glutamine-hydrolysing)
LSGFVGMLNFDGAPVDRALLEQLTHFLAFRGPDAEKVWSCGEIGMGHTLLRIGPVMASDSGGGMNCDLQPCDLDRRLWIAADARIDARDDLIAKLKTKSRSATELSLSIPDARLVLHAYDVWGPDCVNHLIGDFSFAIWDVAAKRLFCARDQFGVKPFFYARLGSLLIFSNTLNCIRKHPGVSRRLNDLAIADFLLFDMNQDPATTSFADIQRLPPAHTLTCEREKVSVRRYWELSVTEPVHFKRHQEYIERFLELLDTAVADRLRTENVGVLMSGGLDSPTVAASAHRILSRSRGTSGLRAYTEVYDSLIPHEERYYAGLVADGLKIPIEYLVSDDWKLFERADQPEFGSPEPIHSALPNTTLDQLHQVKIQSRVALTGYGGDPALCGRISVHFRQLLQKKKIFKLVNDAARFLGAEGRLSRLYIATRWRIFLTSKKDIREYPPWLNETLGKKLDLRDRWASLDPIPSVIDAVRPEAHVAMVATLWPNLFESHDAGFTGIAIEVGYPIFDLRLQDFLLGLPRLPWCTDKELLREAGRGILPDRVRLRRKSTLQSDPLVAALQRPESSWVDHFDPSPELEQYVATNRVPAVHGKSDCWAAWVHLKPLSLNFWLRVLNEEGKTMGGGHRHDG